MEGPAIMSYSTLDECKSHFRNDPNRLQFIEYLQKFLSSRNEQNSTNKPQSVSAVFVPVINNKCLDIYELYQQVNASGGYEVVNKDQKWTYITTKLGFPPNETASVAVAYSSLLLPLEKSTKNNNNNRPINIQTMTTSNIMNQPKPVKVNAILTYPNTVPSIKTNIPQAQPLSGPFSNSNIAGSIPSHPNNTNVPSNSHPPSYYNQHTNQLFAGGTNVNSHGQSPNIQSHANVPQFNASINVSLDKYKRTKPYNPLGVSESTQSHNMHTVEAFNEKMMIALKDLNSKDIESVVKSLNFLNQKSFEMTESQSINIEAYPQLVVSLIALLDVVNPISNSLFPCDNFKQDKKNILTEDYWSLDLPGRSDLEFKVTDSNSWSSV